MEQAPFSAARVAEFTAAAGSLELGMPQLTSCIGAVPTATGPQNQAASNSLRAKLRHPGACSLRRCSLSHGSSADAKC